MRPTASSSIFLLPKPPLTPLREAGLPYLPVLTYLANEIRFGDRSIPYSTVTALDTSSEALFDSLLLSDGEPAPKVEKDEVLLNEWAARDLRASVGDEVELAYYVVGPQGSLETGRHTFSVKDVVKMSGLALDRRLAPTYKGMSDATRMGDWDPPFPVDLSKIRPIDEDYWDRYRTAPKAFISLETAKKLWTSRFGQLTSVRIAAAGGRDDRTSRGCVRKGPSRSTESGCLRTCVSASEGARTGRLGRGHRLLGIFLLFQFFPYRLGHDAGGFAVSVGC